MLPLLALAPSDVSGTFVSEIGRVGQGGSRTTLRLSVHMDYVLTRRGCFVDSRALGRYAVRDDAVWLAPPDARPPDWPGRNGLRFRVIRYGGTIYLVRDSERGRFADAVRRGVLDHAGFLRQDVAPMSLR